MATRLEIILEILGLDLIPWVIGLQPKDEYTQTRYSEILAQLDGIEGKKLDEALLFAKDMLEKENTRGEAIEIKAQNLLGVTGVATAFITGITGLLPEKVTDLPTWQIIMTGVIYLFVVFTLIMTILLAFRVIRVGSYKTVTPDIDDVFSMSNVTIKDSKKNLLTTYIYSYKRNQQVYNNKATYLIGSQLWFRNAIIMLLVLALMLALDLFAINPSPIPPGVTTTPYVSPQASNTAISPTATLRPSATNSVEPTKTNSATPTFTVMPSSTQTITRTSVITPTQVSTRSANP